MSLIPFFPKKKNKNNLRFKLQNFFLYLNNNIHKNLSTNMLFNFNPLSYLDFGFESVTKSENISFFS